MRFEDLPGHARLWMYTADRELTADEQGSLLAEAEKFLSGWSAHGAALVAAATVRFDRVLAVGLDEEAAAATGCSIDKFVSFVGEHGARHGIDWFDRHIVLYRAPEDAGWTVDRTAGFWALRKAGRVSGATRVVDPLLRTKEEWHLIDKAFDESWHAEMWR